METTKPVEGGAATGTPTTSSTMTDIKDMLTRKGLTTLPLWSHIFFTGVLPFGPLIPYIGAFFFSFFHTFGVNGVNLLVSNAMGWAAAKALTNLILSKIGDFIAIMYSNRWWVGYLKNMCYYGNPWFVYDWVQVVGAVAGYNEPFKKLGYKIPFINSQTDSALKTSPIAVRLTNKSIGFRDKVVDASGRTVKDLSGNNKLGPKTYGLLSALPLAAILVLFMPALNLMAENLPAELRAEIQPAIDKLFYWVGATSAVLGGTVGATGLMGLIPNILTFMKPETLVNLVPTGPPTMSGGGENGIPTLKEITEAMLNETPPQSGGGEGESTAFMGILGFTVFAGLMLAFVRGKHFPFAK